MKIEIDPLLRELQRTVRNMLNKGKAAPTLGIEHLSNPAETTLPEFPFEQVWEELVEMGVLSFGIPIEFDGMELGNAVSAMVSEEMGRVLLPSFVAETLLAADAITQSSRTDLAEKVQYLIEGTVLIGTLGIHSGLEKTAAQQVERTAEGWVVNGEVGFLSYPDKYQELLIAVQTGDRPSLFLVPADRAGIEYVRHGDLGDTNLHRVRYVDLQVSEADRLVELAADETLLPRVRARARIRQAAYLLGLADGALEQGVKYASKRKQFDKTVLENQAVGFRFASLKGRIEVARLIVQQAAWLDDKNEYAYVEATEALAMCAELAQEATREALHFHGSFGLTKLSEIQRFYRRSATESVRYGTANALWLEAGKCRLQATAKPLLAETV